jgi:hypothetical protein
MIGKAQFETQDFQPPFWDWNTHDKFSSLAFQVDAQTRQMCKRPFTGKAL